MFERGVLAEDEGLRAAVEIAIGLESVHEHDQEGGGGEETEGQHDEIKGTAPEDIRELSAGGAVFVDAPGDAQPDKRQDERDQ